MNRNPARDRSYDKLRKHAIHNGTWVPPYVKPDATQARLRVLLAAGHTYCSIATLTGLDVKTLQAIHNGDKAGRPVTRIRRTTAAKIRAVGDADLPDKTRVDAAPTWELIDDLRARGWTYSRIAQEAFDADRFQIRRDRILASTARRIEALHERVTGVRSLDLDELELLLGTDTPDSIARRLGYAHAASLERVLERKGRRDLVSRLYARQVAA